MVLYNTVEPDSVTRTGHDYAPVPMVYAFIWNCISRAEERISCEGKWQLEDQILRDRSKANNNILQRRFKHFSSSKLTFVQIVQTYHTRCAKF